MASAFGRSTNTDVTLQQHSNNSWHSSASLLCFGTYLLEILLLYRNFSAVNLTQNCVDAVRLLPKPYRFSTTLDCTYSSGWLVRSESVLESLSNTRIQRDKDESMYYDWNSAITYKFEKQYVNPFQFRKIVFAGDSHMRHLCYECAEFLVG